MGGTGRISTRNLTRSNTSTVNGRKISTYRSPFLPKPQEFDRLKRNIRLDYPRLSPRTCRSYPVAQETVSTSRSRIFLSLSSIVPSYVVFNLNYNAAWGNFAVLLIIGLIRTRVLYTVLLLEIVKITNI